MALLPSWVKPEHLKIPTIVIVALIHVAALAAPFTFSWSGLIACFILFWVTGGLGITLCFHRLLTHRSYTTPKPVEYVLTLFGCLALQGGPITWVATHRVHHKESDLEPDPHTPVVENFLWAHILWNFFEDPKLNSYEKLKRFAKDLDKDPVLRFLNKSFFVLYLIVAVGLYAVGHVINGWELGLSLLVWGVALRTVLVWHSTWLVNSATHLWG
ncbi:MAG: fatty acid desaturase, partial [Candidatus Hydrogenedentes bacterium]|nr:fatty acid desaturase [Candidatus Hydrogenedentota bacterium]